MRPVFGLSETDLYSKSWTNPGIQHVSDVQCVANCSMRNAFIGREKCTAEMTFIGKNFSWFLVILATFQYCGYFCLFSFWRFWLLFLKWWLIKMFF